MEVKEVDWKVAKAQDHRPCKWLQINIVDPQGRPTVTAGRRDHRFSRGFCIYICPSVRPPLFKISQNKRILSENSIATVSLAGWIICFVISNQTSRKFLASRLFLCADFVLNSTRMVYLTLANFYEVLRFECSFREVLQSFKIQIWLKVLHNISPVWQFVL